MPQTGTKRLWLRRMGWLVLIWGLSVAALGLVAWLFRIFMELAGLTL
ncbi:DUF2474 domain-containing protein [Mesorhizobium sp. RMAD-H1]|nr:DUF2474 domain-containing protein [Mesorhizobium sp. RMAD-H1]MBB2970631.1 hypothetical protein [Mesorhizobium sp. RMAD-H1]